MTSLFSTRRRAEQFALALEERPQDLDAELQTLVALTTGLQGHARSVTPRPEFTTDLRTRLVAEAESVLTPDARLVLPQRTPGRRERRLVAAATAAVLLGGSAGMAAAAQSALPGETLYPIKRGIEKAEANLSVSDAAKGRDLLSQATGRLDEVENLLSDRSPTAVPRVPGTLADFGAQSREGADLLLDSFRETRDADTVLAVRDFAAVGVESLEELARHAPEEVQEHLAAAALELQEIDRRAVELCASCSATGDDLRLPDVFLTAAEVDRAFTAAADSRLDNSHPVVVPRGVVDRREDRAGGAGSEQPTGGGADAPAPEAPSDNDPAPAPTPGPELVPDDEPVAKSGKKVKDAVKDTVDGVTGGLGDVVETLLPDADGKLLP
jgi:hypothetical protein